MRQKFGGKQGAIAGETFEEVLVRSMARRSFLKRTLVAAPLLVAGSSLLLRQKTQAADVDKLEFQPIALDNQDRVLVAEGYEPQVLIRWGDPLFPGAPTFDVNAQTPLSQARQFGTNCDYVVSCSSKHFRNSPDSSTRGAAAGAPSLS